MKTVFAWDKAIENAGGLQATGLPLPDVTIVDVGLPLPSPVSVPSGPASVATLLPGIPTSVLAAGLTESPSPAAIPAATVSFSGMAGVANAPLVIHAIFGDSILNKVSTIADPSTALQIETAINTAIDFFQTGFVTSVSGTIASGVTVNIAFDYGLLDGVAMTSGSAALSSSSATLIDYDTLRAALPGVPPLVNPTGNGTFFMPFGQMKLLGISQLTTSGQITANSTEIDGFVGINTIANNVTMAYDPLNQAVTGEIGAVGAIEHEVSELLGRIAVLGHQYVTGTPSYSLLDLFRYSAPGVRALTSGASDYFSLDDGATNLIAFNDPNGTPSGGDSGDWASSGGTDAFSAFLVPGNAGTISAPDRQALTAAGLISVTCYREGTRLLTTTGEKRIETLAIGDELTVVADGRGGDGAARDGTGRVVWIGRRSIDLTRHPQPERARPVRVRAGAFAPGLPSRDLWLSPDHAVYADGVLIPVKRLLNGVSIAQVPMERVVYWHVELDRHAVILAEGLPAESYLDTGDRDTFADGAVVALHPDFAARRWETEGCAPLVLTGRALDAVRRHLDGRAELNGRTGLDAAPSLAVRAMAS